MQALSSQTQFLQEQQMDEGSSGSYPKSNKDGETEVFKLIRSAVWLEEAIYETNGND